MSSRVASYGKATIKSCEQSWNLILCKILSKSSSSSTAAKEDASKYKGHYLILHTRHFSAALEFRNTESFAFCISANTIRQFNGLNLGRDSYSLNFNNYVVLLKKFATSFIVLIGTKWERDQSLSLLQLFVAPIVCLFDSRLTDQQSKSILH